jgi:enoyl-CoA hydratase/carnithine racemase
MSLDATLDDSVLWLTLNRPDRYNAIDPELRDLLVDGFETATQRGAAFGEQRPAHFEGR